MKSSLDQGISTRRGIMCVRREPADADIPHCAPFPLNESERVQDHTIILPLYHQMTEAEQDRVVQALARSCSA